MNSDNRIVGQQNVLKTHYAAITADQFSHAVLFYGPSGYGSLPIALEIAAYLVCQKPSVDGPCGTCIACHKSLKWIHPDIHFAFPVVKKGSSERKNTTSVDYLKEWREMLGSNPYMNISDWVNHIATSSAKADINVAECNQISHQLTLQSFEEGRKVQIIWMADHLGINGNRLLKLIEEPPANTFIILICDDPDMVLNTIKSRCRMINIPRIEEEAIKNHLIQAYHLDEERAGQIAFLSEGDFAEAMGYIEVDSGQLLQIALQLFQVTQHSDILGIRDWVEGFNDYNAQEQRGIISYLLKLLREMLHHIIIGYHAIRLGKEEIHLLEEQGVIQMMNVHKIEKISNILSESLYLLSRNANTKVLMYNSCLEIESVLHSEELVW